MKFITESKLKELKKSVQVEYANTIKAWHEEYDLRQAELETSFDLDSLDVFKINVWDEIDDNASFAYVEMSDIPDSVCFDVMNHLRAFLLTEEAHNISIRYYDSTNIYPSNLLFESGRYTSFKRWELYLKNVDYEKLDRIVTLLQSAPNFKHCKLDVYSES